MSSFHPHPPRRCLPARAVRLPVVVGALLGAFVVAAGSCGAGTGGEAVLVDLRARGSAVRTFTTSNGWQVTLDAAAVAFGPVYFAENPPPRAARWTAPSSWWAGLAALVVPQAHAHAGDNQFNGGQVFAEIAEFVVVDALADAGVDFDDVGAVGGRVRSWEVNLPAAAVEVGAPLFGHQAFARGTATKDGVVVVFAGGTTPESDARRRVQGLPVDAAIGDGATITVRAHPEAWFDGIDFAALVDEDGDGVVDIAAGDAAAAFWSAALRGAAAWSVAVD
jgi:hypothetical protein